MRNLFLFALFDCLLDLMLTNQLPEKKMEQSNDAQTTQATTGAAAPATVNPLPEQKPAEEEDFLSGVMACSIIDPTCEACQ